ncbi:hypothetical protein MLD38_024384 [Melastoma candidum]|uniref:Uncharacterized protein n=1 Tax=Melastoma candidum TaxID=119954 RepID=A0ACB9NV42_9MYRT|nr:hypothetical protein MLD38_024384 [Melastoma candidum]
MELIKFNRVVTSFGTSTCRGRNFRHRVDDDDDEDGGCGGNNTVPPAATPTASKPPSNPCAASSSSKPKKPDHQKQAPKPNSSASQMTRTQLQTA